MAEVFRISNAMNPETIPNQIEVEVGQCRTVPPDETLT